MEVGQAPFRRGPRDVGRVLGVMRKKVGDLVMVGQRDGRCFVES